ncbi:GDSL-type esterase/lipase family protein [Blastococcus capsensis]|uniref:GDSL-type esterase/lipase family protein n=1 Tax=Blastococcus capsensis TaxID=1564163 RepID=UPI0025413EC8|nr:GDSL-type esterase/lipase family protein [Blastococcus capsensis]MDK3257445.1 GDSL-type esterase/lipase family protein [Blastococcus capsensis]
MPSPDLRVCFFGDSLTAGVGDDAAMGWVGRVVASARRAGTDLTGYNLGVRRETSQDVQARWLAEARPRLRQGDGRGVVLAVGVNDTTVDGGQRRVPQSGTLRAVRLVADQAGEQGWPLLAVGPTLVHDDQQNRLILDLSEAMGSECTALHVPYVEIAAGLQDDEWLREVAARDGAHPSARGYERLSRVIRPVFTEWLGTVADGGRSS